MNKEKKSYYQIGYMRYEKKDLTIVFITFLISLFIVAYGIGYLVISYAPNYKEATSKAKISKIDLVLNGLGKQIPEDKVNIFNSVVDEKYKLSNGKNDPTVATVTIMLLLFLSVLLTALITLPYFNIKAQIIKKQRLKADKLLRKNYAEKYSLKGKNTYTKCIDSSLNNKAIVGKTLLLWMDGDVINFVNRDYRDDIGLIKISMNSITCFSRYGDFYTSMNISGGDSSYGRAAIGYLLGGAAGAIVASRNSIRSNTEIHDNRETLVFINENDEQKFAFFSPEFYDYLFHIIPNKEITYSMKVNTKTDKNSRIDELSKLVELKEKGIIDEVEFAKLKNELIFN